MQERQTSALQPKRQAKQSKLTYYFASKSPKAMEAKDKAGNSVKPPGNQEATEGTEGKEGNHESKHNTRGPSAPFREIRGGHEGHLTADAMEPKQTSKAMAGCTEERGKQARKHGKGQQRTEWVLGKAASGKKGR